MGVCLIRILTCTSCLPSSLDQHVLRLPWRQPERLPVVQPPVLGSLSLSSRTSCFLLELCLPLLGSLCTYCSLPQPPLQADTGVQIFSWTPLGIQPGVSLGNSLVCLLSPGPGCPPACLLSSIPSPPPWSRRALCSFLGSHDSCFVASFRSSMGNIS